MSESKKPVEPLTKMRDIELVGESKKSWEDAAQRLVKRDPRDDPGYCGQRGCGNE